MAFPDNVTIFRRAKDPSTATDINNINQYQSLLASGDFSGAQDFLAQMTDGIAMNLNAGRYNELIQTIEDIENFYIGLNGVKQYLQDHIDAFTDTKAYDATTSYSTGNIAAYGGNWYISLQDANLNHTPTGDSIGVYWDILISNQKQYPIQAEQPTGQEIGDLWFQVVAASNSGASIPSDDNINEGRKDEDNSDDFWKE